MSDPRALVPKRRGGAEPTLDPHDAPPEVVGRYSLFGKIASGGMATVHLGRLLGPVGFSRTVAVKKLHAHLAQDPDFVLAFVDEARLAARIQHPNVVPTLDVVSEKGQLLLVMEYVMGESLVRLMRVVRARGEYVPPKIAASILSSALHGLHAAHEAKTDRGQPLEIVHRDVSPHNIMVGSDGVTRVLDFGVAKAMGRLQATGQGMVKGKVAYMSPEQMRGGSIDRRCDIYAAGVVLWETLTGRRLFQGETEVEVFARVMAGCPAPPSTHTPDLPEAFDRVTMRALRNDPNERYATAREMAMALEACAGIAMPSEVGPWVASLANDVLAMRARAVAEVESASDIVVMSSSDAPPPPDRADDPTRSAPVSISGVHAQTGVGTEGVRRRGLMLIAGGAVLALVLATWVIASRVGGSESGAGTTATESPGAGASPAKAAASPPPAAADGVPMAPATATATPTATPTPTAAATPSPTTTPTPTTTPIVAAAPPRAVSLPAAVRPHAPARPSSCVPPYTLDSNGFRVPKPECL